jgi:hypothetical protein
VTKPGIHDIPGGGPAPRASPATVSITQTMIAEDLCTYTMLYFRQEKCLRNQGAARNPVRVICPFYDSSGGRPAVPPTAREPQPTMIIFS